jgi:transcriptional regulator GlxA family with amidase domain
MVMRRTSLLLSQTHPSSLYISWNCCFCHACRGSRAFEKKIKNYEANTVNSATDYS